MSGPGIVNAARLVPAKARAEMRGQNPAQFSFGARLGELTTAIGENRISENGRGNACEFVGLDRIDSANGIVSQQSSGTPEA
jgi:hypothetical protein